MKFTSTYMQLFSKIEICIKYYINIETVINVANVKYIRKVIIFPITIYMDIFSYHKKHSKLLMYTV